MKTIVFDDSPNETFNIMVEDNRFMICSRIYTIQESTDEAKKYDDELEEFLEDGFHFSEKYTEYELYEDSSEYTEKEREFSHIRGERPVEYNEDTQCYTIVDKKLKIRGADNYGNKYNYLNIMECEMALKELNTPEEKMEDGTVYAWQLEISRRNRVELSDYKISEI